MEDRKKSLVPFVIAVVFGVVSVIAVNRYITSKTTSAKKVKVVGIIAAKTAIKSGAPISMDQLTVKTIPLSAFSSVNISVPLGSSLQDSKEVEAKKNLVAGRVAARTIPLGDPIMWSDVRAPEISRLANKLSTDMRAVTIPVDALSGVGYNILPGDHVDILASSSGGGCSSGAARTDTKQAPPSTYILMQDVLVLAVAQNFNTFTTLENRTMTFSNITLEVTETEALMLTQARRRTALSCLLRAPGSQDRISSKKLPNIDCDTLKNGLIAKLDAARAELVKRKYRVKKAVSDLDKASPVNASRSSRVKVDAAAGNDKKKKGGAAGKD